MRILIVDDNEDSRIILKKILVSNRHKVEMATNGEKALKMLKESPPDMIIADILMPVMDGFKLCCKVKGDEELKYIPFVFHTATYTDEKDEELALKVGADKFIRKPVEPDEFIKIIQGVIRDVEESKLGVKEPTLEEEKEAFMLYSQRLVKKLEKKMLDLESEMAERKRAEEFLKRTTEQLSMLLESLPIVPYTCKAEGDFGIIYVSGTIKEITGYMPDQFIEDSTFWAEHIHPNDRKRVFGELTALLEHDRHQCEYRFRIADGTYRWFGDSRRFLKLPDGTISHIIGVWQDITEEKKLRQESEYRLQQIIQADKLASLGEVVAGVAHEINNPNSFITYNIPLLEETWEIFEPILTDYAAAHPEWRKTDISFAELCEDMREMIQAIKTGSERINTIVSNLKDFARLDESVHAKPVQVNEVIKKALVIVGGQMRKSVAKIEVNLAGNLPKIQGHFQRLEQVVTNLLLNAAHAIPVKEKGRLAITTRYIERLNSVLIEIEDNGTGMEPGVIERIFEPFFTTRRDAGGTGLGLSVSYGLIREHNGIIGILSRPGLGSRFTVFLPVARDIKIDLRPLILCVDDDAGFISDLKSYFTGVKDICVETTGNPESVVAYLEEHPEVEIVLSNIMMPGINGWKLLEKIKARFPLLAVILYTDHPGALKQKPEGGITPDYLLQKPFKMNRLLEIIETMGRQRL